MTKDILYCFNNNCLDNDTLEKLKKRKEKEYDHTIIEITQSAKDIIDTLDIDALKKLRKEKEDNTDDFEAMCDDDEEYEYICFKIFVNDPIKYDGEFGYIFEYEYLGTDGKYYFIFNNYKSIV
jgi:hypothetical protein